MNPASLRYSSGMERLELLELEVVPVNQFPHFEVPRYARILSVLDTSERHFAPYFRLPSESVT